jgi:hypothetical protein
MSTAINRRLAGTVAAAAALCGAMLVTPTQAHAAWGTQVHFNMQATVSGGGNTFQVGTVHGWVQFDSAGNDFRYSLDVCRQSAYVNSVRVAVNAFHSPQGVWTQTYVSSDPLVWNKSPVSPCWNSEGIVSGSVHSPNVSNVHFEFSGGTFVGGQTLVTDNDDTLVTNPF